MRVYLNFYIVEAYANFVKFILNFYARIYVYIKKKNVRIYKNRADL